MLSDEIRYRLLKLLHAKPHLSQRELADELKISLGKTNYCVKTLLEKGWIEAMNVRNSRNRAAYRYRLTPAGIREKACVTVRFLKRKQAEYRALQCELVELRDEIHSDCVIKDNLKQKNS